MSSADVQARIGQALVDFAAKSQYPDDEAVIAANVEGSALPIALKLLSNAKSSLEDDIRKTSRLAAPGIDTWIGLAKTLQFDVDSAKRLANDIIRNAEADEQTEELAEEQEKYLSFLEGEVAFNKQLASSLNLIQEVHECLERVEALINGRQVLACLQALDVVWTMIPDLPIAGVGRLLEKRASELRASASELLRNVWENLILVDRDAGRITIQTKLDGEITTAAVATNSMIALETLEREVAKFWHTLDDLIIKPRIDLSRRTLRYFHIEGNTIRLGAETADSTIKSLFSAMEKLIRYLQDYLPQQFIIPLSTMMMPELSTRLREFWLDTSVPSSLGELAEYQKSMYQVHEFVNKLQSLSWPGGEGFEDWTIEAPKIWLNKRKETSLDWTRSQLEFGIGTPRRAEHLERQMVGKDEGKHIASSANVVSQDWDAAWDTEEEGEEDSMPQDINRASLEEMRRAREVSAIVPETLEYNDDAADAWGWGEEDVDEPSSEKVPEPLPGNNPANAVAAPETREITLSETYYTSSIPMPVFQTVAGLFNDGAKLTSSQFEDSIITSAAPGLFLLPRLILTMYRAVSPFQYSRHETGNMFAYNDSIWLSDQLRQFQLEWETRTDLNPRAYGKINLDQEIKVLQGFGKRAYTSELNTQRTVISDLLGGAQNFFTEDGRFNGELDTEIESVVSHIRKIAALWRPILQYSAWASSIGSLINSVASKIISDVFDLDSVSSNEAERLAVLIAKALELDDLFIRQADSKARNGDSNGDDAQPVLSMTHQFADRWMKLKSIKLVLESSLDDIRFYWFESDISLHLTAEEVVELIELSFQNNAGARQTKREIRKTHRQGGYDLDDQMQLA